ncbi:MAG: aldo/keto reductase [Phycisphaeraceae bacterium]|nr:aldo/keto reductase [Phycisphaeraceae bacterium]
MDRVRLGNSDLDVSRICLGTVFRAFCDEDTCVAAIHEAGAQGCNYLDCANVYGDGVGERVVGRAVKGQRDRYVISTKVGTPEVGVAGSGGLSRHEIMRASEASLRRLDTDYLDCYLCHCPDPDTPLDETFGALNELVESGKVRYVGVSRFESWRLHETLSTCATERFASPVCNQLLYSMLDRRAEDEVVPYCRSRGVGVTVFAATCIGLLSGRYRFGQPPPRGSSWHRGPYNLRRAMTPQVDRVIETLIEIATAHGKSPTQVAMAWCLAQPGIDVVITGADTPERVRENCGAAGWRLTADELDALDRLTEGHRIEVHKDCPEGWKEDS